MSSRHHHHRRRRDDRDEDERGDRRRNRDVRQDLVINLARLPFTPERIIRLMFDSLFNIQWRHLNIADNGEILVRFGRPGNRFRMRVHQNRAQVRHDDGSSARRLAWLDRSGAGSSTHPSTILRFDEEEVRYRIEAINPGADNEVGLVQNLLEELAAGLVAPIGTLATFGFVFPSTREAVAAVFNRTGAPLSFCGGVSDHLACLASDICSVFVLLSQFELLNRAFSGWAQQYISFRRYQLRDDAEERLRNLDPVTFLRNAITSNFHIPWGYATAAFGRGAATPETTLPALPDAMLVSGPGNFINHFITRFMQMMQSDIYVAHRQNRVNVNDRRSLLYIINQSASEMLEMTNSRNSYERYMGNVILTDRIVAGQAGIQVARILARMVYDAMMAMYDDNPTLNQMRLVRGVSSFVQTGVFLSFVSYGSLLVQPAWTFMFAVFQFSRLLATRTVPEWIELGNHLCRLRQAEQERRRNRGSDRHRGNDRRHDNGGRRDRV